MPHEQTPQNSFTKFSPFRRVEDAVKGGSKPTVWGIATFEQPDLDNEICHYDTAKTVYGKWSDEAAKRTAKAGQAVSFGNIRVQHGMDVGGKATKIEFDDAAREIWLGSEPVNDDMHAQLKAGFYTGYSQGGGYAWRKCTECDAQLALKQRANYCPDCKKNVTVLYGLSHLAEVSYVDVPCINEGFEYVKANGSRELVKFQRKEQQMDKEAKTKRVAGEDLPASSFAYVGNPDDPSTWKLPIKFKSDAKTKSHIRNALARFNQTKGIPDGDKAHVHARILSAAHAHGIDTNEKALTALEAEYKALPQFIMDTVDKAAEAKGFRKGLYSVGCFADVLSTLGYLYRDSVYERDSEGDESEVPDMIAENLDSLIETFLAMAEEEARELAAQVTDGTKTTTGETIMTPEELQKQQEAEKAAKKALAADHTKQALLNEQIAAHNTTMSENHAAIAAAHKTASTAAQSVEKAEGAADNTAQIALLDAIATSNENMSKSFAKTAAAHKATADSFHALAKAADAEEHARLVAEAAKTDESTPAAPAAKATPAVSTLDADVAAAAAAQRNSDEYKDAIKAIAKAKLDAELAELRKATIVPDGVKVAGANSETTAVGKGLNAVRRSAASEEFEFAAAPVNVGTAGL